MDIFGDTFPSGKSFLMPTKFRERIPHCAERNASLAA